ncbi:CBS domain-containing protein [Methanosalsum natronophilum]|uniref:CBS domain-containing protein n=1 Tax=Methanosalsum natronophilum TaxID=768733 RepID=A0A424YWW6_9EURY|nr:CBS domain-containing protein [Methanosalsum natronophilum]RQD84497.1 MAG: CBS domain-containing protein [Methanosalsum natronophilum]
MLLGTDDDDFKEDKGFSMRNLDKGVSVHSVMSKKIFSLDTNESSLKAAKIMNEHNIGSIIVTKNSNVTGIITERDLVKKVLASELNPGDVTVEEMMSSPIISIRPSASTIEAAKVMLKFNIRRLAVMENKTLVGIVTDRDIIAIAPELDTILNNLIEMNRETSIEKEADIYTGICTNCESFSRDLQYFNGMTICESCRDSLDYYD